MTDREIVSLFFKRDETALEACRERFGTLLTRLAGRIVGVSEAELAESSAYLDAWNSIPPRQPESLASYLAMLTRRRAIDLLRKESGKKRGGGEYAVTLGELDECVPSPVTVEKEVEASLLRDSLNAFLEALPDADRLVFMKRYWWFESVNDISRETGLGVSAVKMRLLRTREKLKIHLEKEGFEP